MKKDDFAFFLRIIVALLLAIQVWVWLWYAGVFWLSDSLLFVKEMVKSLEPAKTSMKAFLILVIPVLVVSSLIHKSLSYRMRILFYVLLASIYSSLYLFYVSGMYMAFIWRQIWVYLIAGGVAGFIFSIVLDMLWRSREPPSEEIPVYTQRRKLLSALGLFAGSTGLLGVLAGPLYFWRNRNSYVDVDVSRLENEQLMTVEVANKPVWILKRSPSVIRLLEQKSERLLDPQSKSSVQPEYAKNALRSIRPEYFVAYGICTHLGCSPTFRPDGRESEEPFPSPEPQFFCPCHGGVFDFSGRVYKGSVPPTNLVVPAHKFVSDSVVRIYFPSLAEEWNT